MAKVAIKSEKRTQIAFFFHHGEFLSTNWLLLAQLAAYVNNASTPPFCLIQRSTNSLNSKS